MGEMRFGPLLFKGRHEFIFGRENSRQVSDSKAKTKMTPGDVAPPDNRENKFFRRSGARGGAGRCRAAVGKNRSAVMLGAMRSVLFAALLIAAGFDPAAAAEDYSNQTAEALIGSLASLDTVAPGIDADGDYEAFLAGDDTAHFEAGLLHRGGKMPGRLL
jgi:hypothetical protein